MKPLGAPLGGQVGTTPTLHRSGSEVSYGVVAPFPPPVLGGLFCTESGEPGTRG